MKQGSLGKIEYTRDNISPIAAVLNRITNAQRFLDIPEGFHQRAFEVAQNVMNDPNLEPIQQLAGVKAIQAGALVGLKAVEVELRVTEVTLFADRLQAIEEFIQDKTAEKQLPDLPDYELPENEPDTAN